MHHKRFQPRRASSCSEDCSWSFLSRADSKILLLIVERRSFHPSQQESSFSSKLEVMTALHKVPMHVLGQFSPPPPPSLEGMCLRYYRYVPEVHYDILLSFFFSGFPLLVSPRVVGKVLGYSTFKTAIHAATCYLVLSTSVFFFSSFFGFVFFFFFSLALTDQAVPTFHLPPLSPSPSPLPLLTPHDGSCAWSLARVPVPAPSNRDRTQRPNAMPTQLWGVQGYLHSH